MKRRSEKELRSENSNHSLVQPSSVTCLAYYCVMKQASFKICTISTAEFLAATKSSPEGIHVDKS